MSEGFNLWEIGLKILEKQRRSGKTDSQLARELGVYPSTIGRWFKQAEDKDRPNTSMLQRIFTTYNLTLEEVLMSVLREDDSRVVLEVLDKKPELLINFCKGVVYGIREEEKGGGMRGKHEQEKAKGDEELK
jgi:transposase-like protein